MLPLLPGAATFAKQEAKAQASHPQYDNPKVSNSCIHFPMVLSTFQYSLYRNLPFSERKYIHKLWIPYCYVRLLEGILKTISSTNTPLVVLVFEALDPLKNGRMSGSKNGRFCIEKILRTISENLTISTQTICPSSGGVRLRDLST